MATKEVANTNSQLKQQEPPKDITEYVLGRLSALTGSGLTLPADYSPENALKSAWFILLETENREKKKIITSTGDIDTNVVTRNSVANALLEMIVQGLNPSKNQCYFIVYGTQLSCDPSYQGNVIKAKRVGMRDINAQVIYKGDVIEYAITEDGRKKLIKHEQDFKNIDPANILGAYAIATMEDGLHKMEIMNFDQIKKSWGQGATKGASGAHNNFGPQMCEKTVKSRLATQIYNSSDDAALLAERSEDNGNRTVDAVHEEIQENANQEVLSIEAPTEKVEIAVQPEAQKVTEPTNIKAPF